MKSLNNHSIRDEKFEELRPWLQKIVLVSIIMFVCVGVLLTYETNDGTRTILDNELLRDFIAGIGYICILALAVSGGLLATEWMLRKFSDSWKE